MLSNTIKFGNKCLASQDPTAKKDREIDKDENELPSWCNCQHWMHTTHHVTIWQCQNGKSLGQSHKVKICDLNKQYLEHMEAENTCQNLKMSSFILSLFQADIFWNNEASACKWHPSFSEIYYTVKTDTPTVANLVIFFCQNIYFDAICIHITYQYRQVDISM